MPELDRLGRVSKVRKGQRRPSFPERIPPLENGDHLSRPEFERRYEAMPDSTRAELIEGVVYVRASPVCARHGTPHFNAISWLGIYAAETTGVIGRDNTTVRLDMKNEPQPDAFLIIDPAAGGQAIIDEDNYIAGAPELVVEIAASSASYDLHQKLAAYRRNGVKEYVTWRVLDRVIDWRVLRGADYILLAPDERGLLKSEILPGLTLDTAALIKGDMKRVGRVQRAALRTPEYKAFAAKLSADLKRKR